MEKNTEKETPRMPGKRWFARGIYGSRDVPIRLLDGFIGGTVIVIAVLVLWFALHGGYTVSFDTDGGTGIAAQKVRHGEKVEKPETPGKPGYTLEGYVTSQDPSLAKKWNFEEDVVEESMTLYAVWNPAQILVKLDADGGTLEGAQEIHVTYGMPYGALPVPQKEGAQFDGWGYSGETITEDTIVTMTGEHVLTAEWK